MSTPKSRTIHYVVWAVIVGWVALAAVAKASDGEPPRSIAIEVGSMTVALVAFYGLVVLFIGWVQEERMVGWLRGVWPKPVPDELAAVLDQLRNDWRPKDEPVAPRLREAPDAW